MLARAPRLVIARAKILTNERTGSPQPRDEMAVVAAADSYACVPNGAAKGKPYVLAFSKSQFYVPEAAIVSLPKRANVLPDGETLGKVLATKAPEKWMAYCDPERLMKIKGEEGTCVYTTFEVENAPEEGRFLRFISGTIAQRNFPEWKKKIEDKMTDKDDPLVIRNERQRARYEVLDWSKEKDCPTRAQLHPEMNRWHPVDKDAYVKTCRVEPKPQRRPKGAQTSSSKGISKARVGSANSGGGALSTWTERLMEADAMADPDDVALWSAPLRVGPKGTYTINELNGLVTVTQYKYDKETGAVTAGEASANGADDGDADDDADI